MNSNKLYTPLRYPGGKSKFAPAIAKVMEQNNLVGGHYLEPYAGGAGVALELLFHGHASHIHINDYDEAIYDFWISATKFPEQLLKLLHDTPINMEQWHYWRDVLRGNIEADQLNRGFATLFVNRTNRSGILKGGVIGGLNQEGNYKLDSRFKKAVIAKRIEKIAKQASNINVYNEDALLLLKRCKDFLPQASLIYLDPPYYIKGQGLYRNFYDHNDHKQIADFIKKKSFDVSWVLSYDNVEQIREMYLVNKSFSYNLNYSAQAKYIGSEIIFFSDNLTVSKMNFPNINMAA